MTTMRGTRATSEEIREMLDDHQRELQAEARITARAEQPNTTPPASGAGIGWTLSTEAMSALIKRQLGGDEDLPVFGIDVTSGIHEDGGPRVHHAKIIVCGDEQLAKQLIAEHEQHSILIEQRNRLLAIVNSFGWHSQNGKYGCWCHIKSDFYAKHTEQCQSIHGTLTAIEQEEERRG